MSLEGLEPVTPMCGAAIKVLLDTAHAAPASTVGEAVSADSALAPDCAAGFAAGTNGWAWGQILCSFVLMEAARPTNADLRAGKELMSSNFCFCLWSASPSSSAASKTAGKARPSPRPSPRAKAWSSSAQMKMRYAQPLTCTHVTTHAKPRSLALTCANLCGLAAVECWE